MNGLSATWVTPGNAGAMTRPRPLWWHFLLVLFPLHLEDKSLCHLVPPW